MSAPSDARLWGLLAFGVVGASMLFVLLGFLIFTNCGTERRLCIGHPGAAT